MAKKNQTWEIRALDRIVEKYTATPRNGADVTPYHERECRECKNCGCKKSK